MPNCRYCGHPGAYDSGFSVECPSFECNHYSSDQRKVFLSEKKKWEQTQRLLEEYLDDEEATDPDITPTYHFGITNLFPNPED